MVRRPRSIIATFVVAVLASIALPATAAVVPADVDLTGANATWDAVTGYDYGTDGAPCTAATGGFSGAEDGALGTMTDAFDGGLYLLIDGVVFDDQDGNGNHRAGTQQLTVGPTKMSRLQVSRTERALQGSPTLRTLVKLVNPTNRDRAVTVTWDSALGADDDERTRASSAPKNRRTTLADDWIVTSDDATTPSDPALTFAVYGPGDIDVTNRSVPWAPEDPDPGSAVNEGCVVFRFRTEVPAGQTRYLLFFTEMRATNEKAIAAAPRFENVRSGSALLDGISGTVAKRIVNWDL
ncbi:MAG TPA: hypothetical protein VLA82_10335 [Actinomycetota bacterium]|nr:hypothetical protein [Actinomycetota bacterium]